MKEREKHGKRWKRGGKGRGEGGVIDGSIVDGEISEKKKLNESRLNCMREEDMNHLMERRTILCLVRRREGREER